MQTELYARSEGSEWVIAGSATMATGTVQEGPCHQNSTLPPPLRVTSLKGIPLLSLPAYHRSSPSLPSARGTSEPTATGP